MSALADAARGYIGTPFRHRGRSRLGVDCVGLGVLAYADCGVAVPDFRLYGREPHRDGLVARMTLALGEPVAVAPVAVRFCIFFSRSTWDNSGNFTEKVPPKPQHTSSSAAGR